jgi:hypothetical protein
MSLDEVTLHGVVQPDGSLVLDQPTNLPAGPVTVVLRSEHAAMENPGEGWWPLLQRIRSDREASGRPFLDARELEEHLNAIRDDGDRSDEIRRELLTKAGGE